MAPDRPNVNAVAPLAPNAWLRYDIVRRILPAGITKVLEVGCGQGALGARLAQRYDYLGVEPDHASWTVAERRVSAVSDGQVSNVAVEEINAADFDLICAFEVLEHIEDDAAALRSWAGRLRQGGWLMLSVPAYQHRFGPGDEWAGHFRRYDPQQLADLLTACGYAEIAVHQYGFPAGYLLETARNAVARRRLTATPGTSVADRTAGSGRHLQPSGHLSGSVIRWGIRPFQLMQRAFPHTGTGLVALARLNGHHGTDASPAK